MYSIILKEEAFQEYVEKLDGDRRVIAYTTFVDTMTSDEVWHSLIISGQNPENKPTNH